MERIERENVDERKVRRFVGACRAQLSVFSQFIVWRLICGVCLGFRVRFVRFRVPSWPEVDYTGFFLLPVLMRAMRCHQT